MNNEVQHALSMVQADFERWKPAGDISLNVGEVDDLVQALHLAEGWLFEHPSSSRQEKAEDEATATRYARLKERLEGMQQ